MDIDNITLARGTALVLSGPQGCGKSTVARRLAAIYGSSIEIEARRLENESDFAEALATEPDTVIVDGLPERPESLHQVKAMLTSQDVAIRLRNQPARRVKAPNFIFCTGSADPIPGIAADDRRFWVVRMEG